jgi:porin
VVWQGVIPSRPDDFAAFAVAWGGISDDLQNFQSSTAVPVQTEETVLEWTYRYYVTNFFYIQPDLQYIIRPGATGQIDDALVLGAQISVSF